MEAQINRFEKKIYDLKTTRIISIQMAPQIRLIQNNDSELVEKIQSSLINTIPLWKNQIVIALGITNAKNALMFSIIKLVFLGMTFAFILIYAKRTIMIAFLTIVAPLVGISYTIDKIKDGQSQILDKWSKEYIYTALIMPLDALLFSQLMIE